MAQQHLDDGGNELNKEARDLEQRWVKRVHEVHDETLNVAAIMVLHLRSMGGGIPCVYDLGRVVGDLNSKNPCFVCAHYVHLCPNQTSS
jgi:hypothetical protein